MRPYVLSLAAGLLVGIIYAFIKVRSPAPPAIALIGLLGILVGEQIVPLAKSWFVPSHVATALREGSARHVFGHMPSNHDTTGHDA